MRPFEKREDPVHLMRRRIVIVVLLIVLTLMLRGVWGVYWKEQESKNLLYEATAELDSLHAREVDLRRDMANLKSARGIESILRSEYELAHEGESVIVLVNNGGAGIEEVEERATPKDPWWHFW